MTLRSTIWSSLSLAIGHATNEVGGTGCTVIRGIDEPFVCSAALLGRASATRELATCAPEHLVNRTDAILLTGGSAYGLDAAAGVMRWMEEHGRGFPVASGVVPIVPAASIFDLAPLGDFHARPNADMAYSACANASHINIAEGSVGAGTGALVGKGAGLQHAMKGGIGLGAAHAQHAMAAAIAVVNAFGDVRDAHGQVIAGARDSNGTFLDVASQLRAGHVSARFPTATREHTTIACVAVNAALRKGELQQLATAATAALHKRVTPSATMFDGDVVFAIAPLHNPNDGPAPSLPVLEALAISALEEAIERAVRCARGRDGFPGLADGSLPGASA